MEVKQLKAENVKYQLEECERIDQLIKQCEARKGRLLDITINAMEKDDMLAVEEAKKLMEHVDKMGAEYTKQLEKFAKKANLMDAIMEAMEKEEKKEKEEHVEMRQQNHSPMEEELDDSTMIAVPVEVYNQGKQAVRKYTYELLKKRGCSEEQLRDYDPGNYNEEDEEEDKKDEMEEEDLKMGESDFKYDLNHATKSLLEPEKSVPRTFEQENFYKQFVKMVVRGEEIDLDALADTASKVVKGDQTDLDALNKILKEAHDDRKLNAAVKGLENN